jgi:hypothetical protein
MMTHDQWYIDRVSKRVDPLDERMFARALEILPKRQDHEPYHSGAHSMRMIRNALSIIGYVEEKQFTVVETGFAFGHSAMIFFLEGASEVVSIDNSDRPSTLAAAATLVEFFDGRNEKGQVHTFIHGDARVDRPALVRALKGKKVDLMYVDGGHDEESVAADVALGMEAGAPWFLFDDFFPHWGPGVQPVIQKHNLYPMAIVGTMCLCYNQDWHGWPT